MLQLFVKFLSSLACNLQHMLKHVIGVKVKIEHALAVESPALCHKETKSRGSEFLQGGNDSSFYAAHIKFLNVDSY